MAPFSSSVRTSTTSPSIPRRSAASGYSCAGGAHSPIGRGSTVTCVGGTYLSLRYGFTSDGSGAVLGSSPWSVFPTGAATPPPAVEEDIEIPIRTGAFDGGGASSGGGAFGGGGASVRVRGGGASRGGASGVSRGAGRRGVGTGTGAGAGGSSRGGGGAISTTSTVTRSARGGVSA